MGAGLIIAEASIRLRILKALYNLFLKIYSRIAEASIRLRILKVPEIQAFIWLDNYKLQRLRSA